MLNRLVQSLLSRQQTQTPWQATGHVVATRIAASIGLIVGAGCVIELIRSSLDDQFLGAAKAIVLAVCAPLSWMLGLDVLRRREPALRAVTGLSLLGGLALGMAKYLAPVHSRTVKRGWDDYLTLQPIGLVLVESLALLLLAYFLNPPAKADNAPTPIPAGAVPALETPSIYNCGITVAIALSALVFTLSNRGAIFIFIFGWGIWVLPYLVFTMLQLRTPSSASRVRVVRLLIWLMSAGAAGLVVAHRQATDQNDADRVAAAVIAYQQRFGHFPGKLSDVGTRVQALADGLDLRYSGDPGYLDMRYGDALDLKTHYRFDFASGAWKTIGDDVR